MDEGLLGAEPDVGVPEGDDAAGAEGVVVAWTVGILGVIERVIAWTL